MNTKKLGCGMLVIVALLLGGIVVGMFFSNENRIASNPELIAEQAGFNLPDYIVMNQTDNMDRNSSAWSDFTWKVKAKNPLDEEFYNKLNILVEKNKEWRYDAKDSTYYYHNPELDSCEEDEESPQIQISINKTTGIIVLDYCWWDMFS